MDADGYRARRPKRRTVQPREACLACGRPLKYQTCHADDWRDERGCYTRLPVLSVASVGQGRWAWAVWRTWDAWGDAADERLVACGEAATRAAAYAAGLAAEPGVTQAPSYCVKRRLSRLATERRRNRPAPGTGDAGPVEFLWQYSWPFEDFDGGWNPHRVLRRTRKRVFIDRDAERDWQRADPYDVRTYALDRETLEREGAAETGSGWSRYEFVTTAEKDRREAAWARQRREERRQARESGRHRLRDDARPADALAALGLADGASKADIRRAYRHLAKAHHPDLGGDPERFKVVQRAYETALAGAAVHA